MGKKSKKERSENKENVAEKVTEKPTTSTEDEEEEREIEDITEAKDAGVLKLLKRPGFKRFPEDDYKPVTGDKVSAIFLLAHAAIPHLLEGNLIDRLEQTCFRQT